MDNRSTSTSDSRWNWTFSTSINEQNFDRNNDWQSGCFTWSHRIFTSACRCCWYVASRNRYDATRRKETKKSTWVSFSFLNAKFLSVLDRKHGHHSKRSSSNATQSPDIVWRRTFLFLLFLSTNLNKILCVGDEILIFFIFFFTHQVNR